MAFSARGPDTTTSKDGLVPEYAPAPEPLHPSKRHPWSAKALAVRLLPRSNQPELRRERASARVVDGEAGEILGSVDLREGLAGRRDDRRRRRRRSGAHPPLRAGRAVHEAGEGVGAPGVEPARGGDARERNRGRAPQGGGRELRNRGSGPAPDHGVADGDLVLLVELDRVGDQA